MSYIGAMLNKELGLGAQHPLYSKTGNVYDHLERFPGVLFDPNGYIIFETPEQYKSCEHLTIKKRLYVSRTIADIPGYQLDNRIKRLLPYNVVDYDSIEL